MRGRQLGFYSAPGRGTPDSKRYISLRLTAYDAAVTIKDSSGNLYTGTTNSNGKFSVSGKNPAAPFVIRVQKGSVIMVSCSESHDNVNVTPFTTQIMSFAYGTDLSAGSMDDLTVPASAEFDAIDTVATLFLVSAQRQPIPSGVFALIQ